MPIDSIFVKKLSEELNSEINGANIKKIYNISDNEFLIKLQNKLALYISCSNESRVNLTTNEFVYPATPSNFTMVLRKYLNNFKIIKISNYQNDRIIKIELNGLNDLKDHTTYYLYIELFGRYSNIILTDTHNKIINSLKHINNEFKTVLPNYKYTTIEKPTLETTPNIKKIIENDENIINQLNPCSTKKDFYFTNIFTEETTNYTTLSKLLDEFYKEISQNRRINYLASKCFKEIKIEEKRLSNKKKKLLKDLEKNEKYNEYKLKGDLILTYGFQNKDKFKLECVDFNGNNQNIELKELLSVSENANLYYKKSAKMKRSIKEINTQIEVTNERLDYLNNLLFQLEISNETELIEISSEFIKNSTKKYGKTKSTILCLEQDGYKIFIGKNNLQNEQITFKLSRKNDIWFHVKDLPGSHVLLQCENITNELIELAASYAAYYSKAKTMNKVEVIYSNIKNVKKISGSYPGHVKILNDTKVVIVSPKSLNI